MKAKEIISAILENCLTNDSCGMFNVEAEDGLTEKQAFANAIHRWFGENYKIILPIKCDRDYFYEWVDMETDPCIECPEGLVYIYGDDGMMAIYFWEIED